MSLMELGKVVIGLCALLSHALGVVAEYQIKARRLRLKLRTQFRILKL